MGGDPPIEEGGDGGSLAADGGLSMVGLFLSESANSVDSSDAETSAHKTREELVNMKEEVFQKSKAGYTPVVHNIPTESSRV